LEFEADFLLPPESLNPYHVTYFDIEIFALPQGTTSDWMAMVGFTYHGFIGHLIDPVPCGIKIWAGEEFTLEANKWYTGRLRVDFGNKKVLSFEIDGVGKWSPPKGAEGLCNQPSPFSFEAFGIFPSISGVKDAVTYFDNIKFTMYTKD